MARFYIPSNRYTPPPSPSSNLPGAQRYVRGSIGRAGLPSAVAAARATGLTRLQGVEATLQDFIGLEKDVTRRARIGVRRAALQLLRDSKKLVPVDTGVLRASGNISDPFAERVGPGALNVSGGGALAQFEITVYVVYTAYYALFVHEMTHIPRRNGKMAKFVEIPLRMNRFVYIAIIQNSIDAAPGAAGVANVV